MKSIKKMINHSSFLCVLLSMPLMMIQNLEATWTTPHTFSENSSNKPAIGIDSSNNIVAIWNEYDGTYNDNQFTRLPSGGSWSTPSNFRSGLTYATDVFLAVDTSGNSVAIWQEYDGSNFILHGATLASGGSSWTATTTLSGSGQDANYPCLGVDSSGNAVAVWQRYNGTNYVLQGATLAFGSSTWSSTSDLYISSQDAYEPSLGVDSSGNAFVVWSSFGTNYVIQAAKLASGSTTWTVMSNLSVTGQNAFEPQISVDATGNAVAVWRRYNGSHYIVQSSKLASGGSSWVSAGNISSSSHDSTIPQVAVDPSGNAVANWLYFNGSHYLIQASILPYGGSWSTPVTLSSSSNDSDAPQIGVTSAGNAVASWLHFNGTDYVLQAATHPSGGSWSSATNLSSNVDVVIANMAVSSSGKVAIVYDAVDSNFNNIVQTVIGTNLFP